MGAGALDIPSVKPPDMNLQKAFAYMLIELPSEQSDNHAPPDRATSWNRVIWA